MSSQIKRTLGNYVLVEILGSTGLATAYVAQDTVQNREVVLKLLRPYFSQDPPLLNSIKEYMQGVIELQHPNILPVYSFEEEDGANWIVQKYVRWPNLRQQLRGPVEPGKALALLRQIAQAVDYAHSRGISHRDIKPSNIFVDDDGQAVLSDFGMIVLAEGSHELVKSNLNTPLPTYAAPEQPQGLPEDRRSDIYSLGVLYYEMVTGMVPYHALSPHTMLAKQLYSLPAPTSQLNPSLPKELDPIILKALGRTPEERYSTALEFVEALEGVLGGTPQPGFTFPWASPQEGQELLAETEEPLEHEDESEQEEEVVVCRGCGHGNSLGQHNCAVCWSRLGKITPITREEEESLARQRNAQRRRGRLIRGTVVLAIVLGLGTWMAVQNIGTTQFLAPPVSAISSVPGANEWAMLQRDPIHSGVIASDSPAPTGELKWTFPTGTPLTSSPAIVGDTVYLSAGDRRIVALDVESGELIWEHAVTGPVHSSPAVAGGLVYVGLRDKRLLALDRNSGELVWEYKTENPILSSPTVSNGILYVGSGDGRLYALDAITGEMRWSYLTQGWIISSPAVIEDVVAVSSFDGHLYIIDTKTGKKRLAFIIRFGVHGSPVFQGDTLYIADGKGRVNAIHWRARELPFERGLNTIRRQLFRLGMLGSAPAQKGFVWLFREQKSTREGGFATSPVVAWDKVYVTSTKGNLYALDIETGEKVWEFQAEKPIMASPSVAQKTVFIGDTDGNIYALDAITGEKFWQLGTGSSILATPVVANGLLFVTSQDGTLYVFE